MRSNSAKRRLQFHRGPQQSVDWEIQPRLQRGKGDYRTGCDTGLPDAAEKNVAGHHVHHDGHKRIENLHTGPHPLANHLASDLEIRQPDVLVVEPVHLASLGPEQAGKHHS